MKSLKRIMKSANQWCRILELKKVYSTFSPFIHLLLIAYKISKGLHYNLVDPPQSRSFELRICAQTQDLQIFKKFNTSQMNPKHCLLSSTTLHSRSLPLTIYARFACKPSDIFLIIYLRNCVV